MNAIVRGCNRLNTQAKWFKAISDMFISSVLMACQRSPSFHADYCQKEGQKHTTALEHTIGLVCYVYLPPIIVVLTYFTAVMSTVLNKILNFSSTLIDTLQSQKRRPPLPQQICKWSILNRQKEDRGNCWTLTTGGGGQTVPKRQEWM